MTPPVTVGGVGAESVIYNFAGVAGLPNSQSGLIADQSGTLYGTTQVVGESREGTVFSLTPPATAGGAWTYNLLHTFLGGADGAKPLAGLLLGPDGTLYGTTSEGGEAGPCKPYSYSGCGTVFALMPPATIGGAWTETILYAFSDVNITDRPDGADPVAGLIFGANGDLLGTTEWGSGRPEPNNGCAPLGCGTVFELTPPATSGGAWSESLLHVFYRDDKLGVGPSGGLVAETTGTLFGTTGGGGGAGWGTVFALKPPATAGSPWTTSLQHFFGAFGGDGLYPIGGLLLKHHDLYGTTKEGGAAGYGTVFEVTP